VEKIILSREPCLPSRYRGSRKPLRFNQRRGVHGIPGQRKLKEGDLVSLDVGVNLNGYFGDGAITLPIVKDGEARRLLRSQREPSISESNKAEVGNRLFDISYASRPGGEAWIFCRENFVGHGIGRDLHKNLRYPIRAPSSGPRLRGGMVFAFRAHGERSTYEVRILSDGWTVGTRTGNAPPTLNTRLPSQIKG